MTKTLLVLIALTLPACIVVREGGDGSDDQLPRGGEGEGEGEGEGSLRDEYIALCEETSRYVVDSGCSSDTQHCYDEADFHDASGNICMEHDVAWYDCILSTALLECDHDCDFWTPVA